MKSPNGETYCIDISIPWTPLVVSATMSKLVEAYSELQRIGLYSLREDQTVRKRKIDGRPSYAEGEKNEVAGTSNAHDCLLWL